MIGITDLIIWLGDSSHIFCKTLTYSRTDPHLFTLSRSNGTVNKIFTQFERVNSFLFTKQLMQSNNSPFVSINPAMSTNRVSAFSSLFLKCGMKVYDTVSECPILNYSYGFFWSMTFLFLVHCSSTHFLPILFLRIIISSIVVSCNESGP